MSEDLVDVLEEMTKNYAYAVRRNELWRAAAEIRSLREEVEQAKKRVAEADALSGRMMRANEGLESELRSIRGWLATTKHNLGYHAVISFDVVWKELGQSLEKMTNLASVTLAATRERRAMAGHHDIRFRDASGQETIGLYQSEYDELEKARRLVEGMKK